MPQITFDSVMTKIQAALRKLEELRPHVNVYELDDAHSELLSIIEEAETDAEEAEDDDSDEG